MIGLPTPPVCSKRAHCIILVRNRAKEIAELLNDTEKIRIERKKARQNRNKYQGVGSETLYGMGSGGGSRYGGFGSDSPVGMGGGSGGIGGGGMGSGSGYYDEEERPNRYESSKYDDDEFDDLPPASSDSGSNHNSNNHTSSSAAGASAASQKQTPKAVNLFDFGDEEPAPKKTDADDDWGDFASGGVASANNGKT